MKAFILLFSVLIIVLIGGFLFYQGKYSQPSSETVQTQPVSVTDIPNPKATLDPIPDVYHLSGGIYSAQSFNNCGPASLSMALSYQSKNVTQSELASVLRPYNNPQGGVDDKAVFAEELVQEAKRQGFESINRPNGTIETMQRLLAEDISIIVRTWLNQREDIGHYRVLTGYDRSTGMMFMDDSYNGPQIRMSDEEFLRVWQPFNYGYILIYPKSKSDTVRIILSEDFDEKKSWENAVKRADAELSENPSDAYAVFNKAVARFYLGEPQDTVSLYERISAELPGRMLWYQIEPILAYYQTKQYGEAISHIESVLSNGNLAFSELHLIRGKIYEAEGNREEARISYQKAVEYNRNYKEAKDALSAMVE